jgi:hypothetical protein
MWVDLDTFHTHRQPVSSEGDEQSCHLCAVRWTRDVGIEKSDIIRIPFAFHCEVRMFGIRERLEWGLEVELAQELGSFLLAIAEGVK